MQNNLQIKHKTTSNNQSAYAILKKVKEGNKNAHNQKTPHNAIYFCHVDNEFLLYPTWNNWSQKSCSRQ